MQSLTEAVNIAANTLVASLPASQIEVGGRAVGSTVASNKPSAVLKALGVPQVGRKLRNCSSSFVQTNSAINAITEIILSNNTLRCRENPNDFPLGV